MRGGKTSQKGKTAMFYEEPKDSQVYEKGDYDRSQKKYSCGRRDDISYERMLKKDTPVFVDFTY